MIYAGIMLYPDERRQLHSKLEDIWLQIDAYSDETTKWLLAFLNILANRTINFAEKLFGEKVFSESFVLGSLSISSVSLLLTVSLWEISLNIYEIPPLTLINTLAAVAIGILRKLPKNTIIWITVITLFVGGSYELTELTLRETGFGRPDIPPYGFFVGITGILFSILSDMSSILVTLLVIRRIAVIKSTLTASILLVVDALFAAALCVGPIAIRQIIFDLGPLDKSGDSIIAAFIQFLQFANISVLLPSLLFIAVALTLIAHRILWPVILRPLYSMIDSEVFSRKKGLIVTGASIISISVYSISPELIVWLKMLANLLP